MHIVCLDVPYPPDYGGVFDLFYKLKYLKEEGIAIHLHCFEYGRGIQQALNQYCASVNYYKRQKGLEALSLKIPYIVNSRNSGRLKQKLEKDNYPVLLEGIHCTYLLYRNSLPGRKVILRSHNIEFEYYRQLAEKEKSYFKQAYYKNESRLLKKYEPEVAKKADLVLTVSENDKKEYEKIFGVKPVTYLPVFIPWEDVAEEEGIGNYCLYHGNLSVNENEIAALWLIEEVFSNIKIPLIIAGKKPSNKIKAAVKNKKHITIMADPSEATMEELIRAAQINVLPSFSNTGIKLKLLHALFRGRHCLVNNSMAEGSGLNELCNIEKNSKDFCNRIEQLFITPYCKADISKRKQVLKAVYNNAENAQKLVRIIYTDAFQH